VSFAADGTMVRP